MAIKSKIIILVIAVAVLMIFVGCEVDSRIPYYRYTIDNLNGKGQSNHHKYFDHISDAELMNISLDYPSKEEEQKYIGSYVADLENYDDLKNEIKSNIDIIMQTIYRINFTNKSLGELDMLYDIMSGDLESTVRTSQMLESKIEAALINSLDIDIQTLFIFGNIKKYHDEEGSEIIRIPCKAKITINSDDIARLQNVFPNYYIGDMNLIELYIYFKKVSDSLVLCAWRESSPDPLTVTWFTSSGIIHDQKSTIRLFEIENDRQIMYQGKIPGSKIALSIEEQENIAYLMNLFADKIFNFNQESPEEVAKNAELFLSNHNNLNAFDKFSHQLQENIESIKLMGIANEKIDPIPTYYDELGIYYEAYINLGYEMYCKPDIDQNYINYGNVKIPCGSYFGTIKALLTVDEQNNWKICEWTLMSLRNKTFGLMVG